MKEKICFKCKERKDLSYFYKHPKMKDGHVNKCIGCNKKDILGNYKKNIENPEFIEKEKIRCRKKYYKYAYRNKGNKEKDKRYEKNNPEKVRCSRILRNSLVVQKTKIKEGFNLHHWSYNLEQAKDTIELPKSHHKRFHRFLKYNKEKYLYEDLNGNLLDTKKKHTDYYLSLKKVIELEIKEAKKIRESYLLTLNPLQ